MEVGWNTKLLDPKIIGFLRVGVVQGEGVNGKTLRIPAGKIGEP